MNISHCIKKVSHSVFPRIRQYVQTGFFPLVMWTPLVGCFRKVFDTTFNNSKQVNSSGTNSMTYFNYYVTPYIIFWYLSFYCYYITFTKRCVHGRLIKIQKSYNNIDLQNVRVSLPCILLLTVSKL